MFPYIPVLQPLNDSPRMRSSDYREKEEEEEEEVNSG